MDRRGEFDRMALSIISYLESFEDCKNVSLQCADGVASHETLLWEKRNSPYKLPLDLKSFYQQFNGINMIWTVEINEKNVEIGQIKINRLENLVRITCDGIFEKNPWHDDTYSSILPDLRYCAAFLLDSQSETGDVVLLYRSENLDSQYHHTTTNTSTSTAASITANGIGSNSMTDNIQEPEIWFVDRSARWHYLCKNFTHFFRLMVTHLGIHGWQLAFTPEGLSTITQHWMNIFCKERLIIDKTFHEQLHQSHQHHHHNHGHHQQKGKHTT